jgi:hypothetical protein
VPHTLQVRHLTVYVLYQLNMDPYNSPRTVRIANLQNEGDPWIPCPHPGCILSFTTPNGLRRHSRAGKHKINLNAQPPPSSARLLQRYKPQLVVETSGKTPRIPKVSSLKKPAPLHSDSEISDQESVTHDKLPSLFPLSAFPSPTQLSPPRTLRTPSPQQGPTTAGHGPSVSPSSQTSQTTSCSTSMTSSLSSSSSKSSSSESSSSTSTSSSSELGTYRIDEQGGSESPPLTVSRDNTPNANLMDIDHPFIDHPLNNTTQREDDLLGRDQLQEDIEDDDGVPVSRIYHQELDGKYKLSRYFD